MKEFVIRKCVKCNSVVRVLEDCKCESGCGIKCCGEEMKKLTANSSDGAVEKHVPEYNINGDNIEVVVNHVMESDHYIEWIGAVYKDREEIKYLEPGNQAKASFKYQEGMTLYSYCNKHLLWKVEVK